MDGNIKIIFTIPSRVHKGPGIQSDPLLFVDHFVLECLIEKGSNRTAKESALLEAQLLERLNGE